MGCHILLQGIFPTQGLNPCLRHCRQMLLLSEPPGKGIPNTCSRLHNDRQSYNSATLDLRFSKLTSWGSPGELVKIGSPDIVIQQVRGGGQEFAFLTRVKGILILLVQSPNFGFTALENHYQEN